MKRVHFIGSGYESVKSVYVDADTPRNAVDKALYLYHKKGWKFKYQEIEVEPYEYKEG